MARSPFLDPLTRRPRRDDRLEVTIEGFDDRGRGLGRVGDLSVTVPGAVVGERVGVRVARRRGTRVEAFLDERLDPGPDLVPAPCPHYGTCGGCAFQSLAYPRQLAEQRRRVRAVLSAAGIDAPVDPVESVGEPWHYRNKMELTFGSRRWVEPEEGPGAERDFALGLHVAGRHDRVLDVTTCSIAFEGAQELVATTRRLARARGLAPWDVRTHTGLLRHLILRRGVRTGELLVALVTAAEETPRIDGLGAQLLAEHPAITTLVQVVTDRRAAVSTGQSERVLHGPGTITEELDGLRFRVSAGSFFQTNTLAAERLVQIVREEARVAAGDSVLDLYCGAGTLTLPLAREGAVVEGVESVASAVADARANAAANGLAARFHEQDAVAFLASGSHAPPRVVVVDPPRAGLHQDLVRPLARLGPERIVYVSCNVDAAARDLPNLFVVGYRIERVRPIDLFPHTPHVEVVFSLSRDPHRISA